MDIRPRSAWGAVARPDGLHLEPAPDGIADPDPRVAVAALNGMVERIARRDPTQYQWTYKRFTLRPPGSGERSPYPRDCR